MQLKFKAKKQGWKIFLGAKGKPTEIWKFEGKRLIEKATVYWTVFMSPLKSIDFWIWTIEGGWRRPFETVPS